MGTLSVAEQVRTVAGGGIPEPATWTMLIIGFGAIGAAIRIGRPKAVPAT